MRRLAAFLLAHLLVGSITLQHEPGASALAPRRSEAALGPLASGSSAGPDGTNGTVSVTGALLGSTTYVWWLNNTNATGTYLAKIDLVGSTGVSSLSSLTVGIHNGTATPQVRGSLGSITQTGGPYVTLPPASSNRIYVTQTVSLVGSSSTLDLRITLADDDAESATVRLQGRVRIT